MSSLVPCYVKMNVPSIAMEYLSRIDTDKELLEVCIDQEDIYDYHQPSGPAKNKKIKERFDDAKELKRYRRAGYQTLPLDKLWSSYWSEYYRQDVFLNNAEELRVIQWSINDQKLAIVRHMLRFTVLPKDIIYLILSFLIQ